MLSRLSYGRIGAVALLVAASGCCGWWDRCGGWEERPSLFGRWRGQAPGEFIVPSDCCGQNGGMINGPGGGPFLGTPGPGPNVILPQAAPPTIPPANIQEGTPAQPMPYDPKMQSRPNNKSANEVKTVKGE
jgi:hypothetical protein